MDVANVGIDKRIQSKDFGGKLTFRKGMERRGIRKGGKETATHRVEKEPGESEKQDEKFQESSID